MEISDIKQRLILKQVLDYYGLKPDKHLRLNCPFHADKTPSLQVYYKTHTAYCFSSNCKTHGKSLDVIDFILHKESCSKHEAIEKAKQLITGETTATPIENLTRSAILTKMFIYFKNAIHNSKPAQEYLESRNLSFEKIEVGYNSGQFHQGKRKSEALLQSCLKVGLLLDKGKKSRTGEPAYQPFGKNGVVFPLKNKEGKVVSLYFRSILSGATAPPNGGAGRRAEGAKHYYLKNRQGLYPNYPKANTTKLILTEAIIDAATLRQAQGGPASTLVDYEILALYGTNGLTEEHTEAVSQLKNLEEIIFFFDGDAAGRTAAKKYAELFSELLSGVTLSAVEVPDNEDVNSLLDGHTSEILTELLEQRETFSFSLKLAAR